MFDFFTLHHTIKNMKLKKILEASDGFRYHSTSFFKWLVIEVLKSIDFPLFEFVQYVVLVQMV